MSLLEPMYMEKLCLVNDVIGNRDVIRSGVNGYVCRNADEFVTAIKGIPENPEKTAEMTAQARKEYPENHKTRADGRKYRDSRGGLCPCGKDFPEKENRNRTSEPHRHVNKDYRAIRGKNSDRVLLFSAQLRQYAAGSGYTDGTGQAGI